MAAILAVTAGGCSLTSRNNTASVAAQTPTEAEWRASLDALDARYRENPNDADATIAYARALRATDQRAQAVAVLERALIRNPLYMP